MSCLFRPLFLSPCVLALGLSGCSNDGAAYLIDGPRHAISVERRQDYFWEKRFRFSAVVSRLPDCQRKHMIQKAGPRARVELWQPGPNTYILRIGDNTYVTETQTCRSFARLEEAPPGGYGRQLGVFAMRNGVFSFLPEESPAENASAESSQGVEEGMDAPGTSTPP
ncbi:MAG: hypothetical protein LBO79_01330 [Zoogloeaceae bacterium]|jgi:hypothetical protein|nr:hypothetical protein [Zoogloeaceae bacterium]